MNLGFQVPTLPNRKSRSRLLFEQLEERALLNGTAPSVDAGPDQIVALIDPVLLDATVVDASTEADLITLAYQLDQDLGLEFAGGFGENWGGLGEKWINGSSGFWYFITPDGSFYRWDFSFDLSTSESIATLDASYHADPSRLFDAPDPNSGESMSLATAWSKVSGPGVVQFGDGRAVDTTARFSQPGTYVLQLEADDGENISSDEVTVTVESLNQPLIVNAGADLSVVVSATLALDGTVSSDGPLPPGVLTRWTKVSGPGAVTLGNSTAVDTTASFSQVGTYVLELEARDGQATASDDVIVTVVNPAPREIEFEAEFEAEAGTLTGPMVAFSHANAEGGQFVATNTADQGTVSFSVNIESPDDYLIWARVLAPTPGEDSFFVSVDGGTEDIFDAADGKWSNQWQWTRVNGRAGTGTPLTVDPRLFHLSSGQHTIMIRGREANTGLDQIVITNDLAFDPNPSVTNQAPVVDAGPNRSVVVSAALALNATVSDDGLPNPPGTVATTWSKVSGPGTVTFSNSAAVDTAASFSQVGTYVLRLGASDGQVTVSDQVTITVENPSSSVVYQLPGVIDFSGGLGGHLEVEHSAVLELTEGAVALTFTADDIIGRHALFSKDANGLGAGGHVTAHVNDGRVEVRFQSATETALLATVGGAIALGQQYHLAVTFGGDGFRVYVDGQLAASRSDFTQSLELNSENLVIGANAWSRTDSNPLVTLDPFDGRIEGFTIYGEQLGADEVAALAGSDPGTNQAPVVDAGPDRSAVVSASLSLDGTVTDDRLSNASGIVASTWSKVSGPGAVTFSDASSVDTTASFPQTGLYVLSLEANDGSLTSSDSVTVAVTDEQQVSGFFVSPSGTSGGDGSINNPWDLATAVSNPAAVQAGDTIWLRGGTYYGGFTSTLTGTANAPIVVRAYPGEHVILDTYKVGVGSYIYIQGDYTHWRDFEVMSSKPNSRITSVPGPNGQLTDNNVQRGALYSYADHTKFINLVVHDLEMGIGLWSNGVGGEIYGSVIYNNGWLGPNTGNGHSIYTQNENGVKRIADNVIFNSFDHGIHAYGSSAAHLKGLHIEGNAMFDAGAAAGVGYPASRNILVGGGTPGENITVKENFTYQHDAGGGHPGVVRLGYSANDKDLTLTQNYFVNRVEFPTSWDQITSAGNTVVGSVTGSPPGSGITEVSDPTGVQIFVRPNEYEVGRRGHIVVYNWDEAASVNVDLSNVLTVGATYEIHHVYDVFGSAVVSGVYNGSEVQLPMNAVTAPRPIGGQNLNNPVVLGPEFGSFIVTTVSLPPANLVAANGSAAVTSEVDALRPDQLAPIVEHAISEWGATGLSNTQIEALTRIEFRIADLEGPLLGQATPQAVTLDTNAASHGWFIDATPDKNEEFTPDNELGLVAKQDSLAADRMDLLTVVMHELGHVLGHHHDDAHDVMAETLTAGMRKDFDTNEVDRVIADDTHCFP